jgi:hypothetical protein
MDLPATRLGHVSYELDMLHFTFDKLTLVEQAIAKGNIQQTIEVGLRNALMEAFCVHARNLDEFFQAAGKDNTLKAKKFTGSHYKPIPSDDERKRLIKKIQRPIAYLSKKRTAVPMEKIDFEDRAKLFSILIREVDNFTRFLKPELRLAWEYPPSSAHRPGKRLGSLG